MNTRVLHNLFAETIVFVHRVCRHLPILFLLLYVNTAVHAQSAASYSFTTNTTASLTDMSSGTSTLIIADTDDGISAITNIGFDFWLQGQHFSQFSVNSNGLMKLGATDVQLGNPYQPLGQASVALITAYGADQRVHSSGKVHYKIMGTAPNRLLIVEWLNMQADFNAGGTADLTYQIRLYETTGVIEEVYGTMNMSVAGAADDNSKDPHIGFSSGNVTNSIGSVTAPQSGTPAPTYDGISAAAATNLYIAGTITTLHSAADGSRRIFIYTPPLPAAPANLSFTAVGISSMTLNWTDNATNETGFAIYRSTDGINYTFINQAPASAGTGAAVNSVQTGLNGSTLYYWKVIAVTEGALSASLDGSQPTLICSIAAGTYTVGPTGFYPSLTAALAALNVSGIAGPVILELQATYTSAVETFPLGIGIIPCAGPVNTLTIRPQASATSLSISSAHTTATIDMNGANYVIIDGRPGGTGTVKQLTIANTSTATGGTAIRFINDASANTVKYTVLRSSFPSVSSGVVVFSTTTGANGNDNNLIDNCDIDGNAGTTASPTLAANNGIYSLGTVTSVAQYNSGNIISNCNIYNNFVTGSSTTSAGILLLAGNTGWNINANSIYQTSARTVINNGAVIYGIGISNPASGNNFSVTNNFIGGSTANCGGTAWTIGGAFSNRFNGIGLSVDTAVASSVQGNTIANFSFTSTSTSSANSSTILASGIWSGIMIAAGNANIGTIAGNTIGSPTGNGSVFITGRSNGATANGIGVAGLGIVAIKHNMIGSITTTGSTATIATGIIGIQSSSEGIVTIDSNTIGSITTLNSLQASNASTGNNTQIVTGINNTGTATAMIITNNLIANLHNAYLPATANTNRIMAGIVSTGGINTITGNTVRNLGTAANATGAGAAASVIGISLSVATEGITTVSQNTVYAITNNNITAASSVTGIYYAGPATLENVVAQNNIYNLGLATTSSAASIRGIHFNNGRTSVENNFIRLGYDTSGAPLITGIPITGIYESAGTSGSGIYFNSVYIGGTGVGTETGNTFAFRSDQVNATRTFENNIFVNARSNSSAGGKHYAVRVAGTTANPPGLTLNYNDYFVSGTGGVFGFYNGLDVNNLASWQAFAGEDVNSISGDPVFINASGITPNLHINPAIASPVESAGIAIATIAGDIDGQDRSTLTPTDIGADAGNFLLSDISVPVITYTPLNITCNTGDRTLTVNINDASGLPVSGVLMPRIYYRKNAGAYFSSAGVLSSGTATSGVWTFTIVASDMGGIASPDVISYFVIAQDMATTPNIISLPSAGLVAANVNTVSVPPTTPNTYTIKNTLVAGTYSIGVAGVYPTLSAAVAVYNSSCISGAVTFELLDAAYPGETFPIVINSNADAGALNTLTIKPATGVNTVISGNSTTAIIVLNGADFVTIDGSNINTANTICPANTASRNLTIANTNTGTASAVVWLQTSGSNNGTSNNTVKNCNITGKSSTSTLFGIGSGSSIINTHSLGNDNNNNRFENNNIKAVQVGIYSQGAGFSDKNSGNIISQNVMNTPSGSGQNIRIAGIMVGYENNLTISGNTIASVNGSSADAFGIACGNLAISNTLYSGNEVSNVTIAYNKIDSIRPAGSFSVSGIFITSCSAAGTNVIANNTIANITTNGTLGDFGSGIFIGGGIVNTNIYFNSVSISGTLTGGNQPNFALAIGGNDPPLNIRNNVFCAGSITGSAITPGLGEYAVGYGYSAFNSLVSNYNDLFTTGAEAKFAKTGSLLPGSGTDITTLAALRTATNQEAASISVDPLFNGLSNLKPQTGSLLIANGNPVGSVTDDIACTIRDVTNPSIGAYENSIDAAVPVITYTALSGTCLTVNRVVTATITDISGVPVSGILQPRIYYCKNGGAYFSSQGVITSGTATNGTWNFTIVAADMGGLVSADIVSYFIIAQDVAAIINIGSSPSAGLQATDVNTVITAPVSPNTYLIQTTMAAGTYTVGIAGNYPTLTAAINAYNNSCLVGAVVFELTDANYTEAGSININAHAEASAANSLTIRPASGVVATVTASVANGPLIKILGNYITIDGSNNGTAGRNLTLVNSNSTMPNVIWVSSSGTTAVNNISLKNCIMINGANTATALFVSNGNIPGMPGYFNNISIQNNSIEKAYIGISAVAVVSAGNGNGLNISGNDLSATGANAISYTGIYAEGVDGVTVYNNTIGNFDGSNDENDKCIWIANSTKNATVSSNRINNLAYAGTGGYGCHGIYVSTETVAANVLVVNNAIANLTGDGWDYDSPFLLDNTMGIALIGTQSGINIYFNSIHLAGSALNELDAMSMGIYLAAGSAANVRNNIVANNLGLLATKGYGSSAVYAAASNTQFALANHNDYYVNPSGAGNKFIGQIGAAGSATLAQWKTATGQETNSISADPLFTSASNLALQSGSPALNAGIAITGITTDINNAARTVPPAMGAFEGKLLVSAKIFLQGAYSSGLGRHKDVTAAWAAVLNANALNQPYNTTAFGNYNGGENVPAGFFTSTGAATDITDWVLIELRDAATPSTVIARRAAFVREDGLIVDTDGVSAVSFSTVAAGNYFIAIRHRNHLGARTAVTHAINGSGVAPVMYDFSTAQGQAFQNGAIVTNAAMKDLGAGKFGLWGGNANANTTIRANGGANPAINDYAFLINLTLGGNATLLLTSLYSNADLNLDGTVRANGGANPSINDYAFLINSTLGGNATLIISQHQ